MGYMKYSVLTSLAAITVFAIPASALAVDVPSTVESGRLQQHFSTEKPASQINNETLIQDEKSGADLKNAASISFTLSSVNIEGNTVFSKGELEQYYSDKVGQQVTLAEMYGVRDAITKYYREKGYILSRAIIPAQRLGKGKADFKFRIIEGYINNVSIEGDFKGDKDILDNYLGKIRTSGPLNSNQLERYLLLINDLAGTKANAVLRPSPGKGGAG